MRCGVMAHRIAGEVDVEDRIKEVLERFVNQRFNDVTITAVKRQYKVDDRWADIAVLKDDGRPILLIETKKKYERGLAQTCHDYLAKTKTSGYGEDTISREARRLLSINGDSAVGRISRREAPSQKKLGKRLDGYYSFKRTLSFLIYGKYRWLGVR